MTDRRGEREVGVPERGAPEVRVVVTGVGVVSACGLGLEPLAAAFAAGAPCARPIERLQTESLPVEPPSGESRGIGPRPLHRRRSRTAARVAVDDYGPLLSRREARRMSPPSIYAVAASRMALGEAGLADRGETDPGCGVVLATAYGPSSFTQRMLDQILEEGPEAISPFLFMESVANAPAGQVAILCGAAGPNQTLCQREAGPVAALGRGAAEVARGRAERTLAGASEEVTPLLHTVLDRFGALSDAPRPLDRRRDGFLAAEGATVLVLESEAAARRRGVPVRARVRAWGGTFDPTAPAGDWGEGGEAVARSLRRGLERAGVDPAGIDAVVSGASGARRGDRLEAAVLRALFSPDGTASPEAAEAVPPLLVPKGITGEYGGAPLAAALLALEGRPPAPPVGFGEADPELGLAPHPDPGALVPPRRLLITSQAAGGAGAWVILDAPEAP